MKLSISLWLIVLCLVPAAVLKAQDRDPDAILLTGMVLDADTRAPLPYVNIQVMNTIYGTATDVNGYFSLFLSPGDTIIFSYIGYTDSRFIMPAEVTRNSYSLIQLMRQETILLSEVVIFPWPSVDNFKQAFLDTEPERNMDDLVREVQLRTLEESRENNLDEYEADQRRYQRLYEMHQIFPPNNFLNPVRWNKFIREVTGEEQE